MLRFTAVLLVIALASAASNLYWLDVYDSWPALDGEDALIQQARAFTQQDAHRPKWAVPLCGNMEFQLATQHAAYELELSHISADQFDQRVDILMGGLASTTRRYPNEILLASVDLLARMVYDARHDLASQILSAEQNGSSRVSDTINELINANSIATLQRRINRQHGSEREEYVIIPFNGTQTAT